MEKLFSGATVSVARRRLKMLACLLLGILILSSVVTGGYFAYKKIQNTVSDSSEFTAANAMQRNHNRETSPRSHLSVSTQITSHISVEVTTMSDIVPRSSEALHDSTLSPNQTTTTTLQSTEQTDISTIDSSNQHASTTFMVTSSSSREAFLTNLSSRLAKVTTPTPIQTTITDPETTTTHLKLITTDQAATTSTPQVCSPTSPDYCECVAGGMWTVIQRRFDGSVDFFRTWTEYKDGFGDENGELWLGNEALHQMTSSANYMLKLNLTNWDNITKYAVYDTFRVADEDDGYRLTIGGYCGDAGDSMTNDNNGQMFSTKDRDNDMWDNHCAQVRKGGWWYQQCGDSNLNGEYYHDNNFRGWGINWYAWPNFEGNSLKETTMMIKEVF